MNRRVIGRRCSRHDDLVVRVCKCSNKRWIVRQTIDRVVVGDEDALDRSMDLACSIFIVGS